MAVMRNTTPRSTPNRSARLRIAAALTATAAAAALGALSFPAHAAPAEGTVVGSGATDAVRGSYLVTLKRDAGFTSASAHGRSVISEYGGTVRRTYTAALNGYAATLSAAQARRLAADPAVDQVFQDRTLHALGTQTNPPSWGLDRIDQTNLPLDQKYTYPDTAGPAPPSTSSTPASASPTRTSAGGRRTATTPSTTTTPPRTATGTAPMSRRPRPDHLRRRQEGEDRGVRVLNNAGSGTTAQVVAGIDWVTSNHAAPRWRT